MESCIAGCKDGNNYIGYVDMYGSTFECDYLTTGLARYICGHIINNTWNKDCSLEEAITCIEECFKVMFARGKNQGTGVTVSVLTKDGIQNIRKKIAIEWNYETYVNKQRTI